MAPRLSHQPGDLIAGRAQYEVLERIRSGGMGTVYKVKNTLTGNFYAVKECDLLDDPRKKQLSREEALRIFIREGQLLETLKHPGIPAGFLLEDPNVDLRICLQCGNGVPADLASCPLCSHTATSLYYRPQIINSRYYLFMEYIDGRDAGDRAGTMNKPLDARNLRTVLHWLHEVAGVLAFLHNRRLIHRDVKPENIRIAATDGSVYLLDYGLLSEWDKIAGTGGDTANLGTEGYAPPEQIKGLPEPASDIYALAMTFLGLASELSPDNPSHRRQLLERDPAELVPTMDAELASLVARSLNVDPAARPAADAWVQVLEQWLSLARPITPGKVAASQGVRPSRPGGGVLNRKLPDWRGWRQGIHRRQWAWAAIALASLILVWLVWPGAPDPESFLVEALPRAVVYADLDQRRQKRRLAGGEELRVKVPARQNGGNWLRVMSVDGERLSGYIDRGKVFRKR